MTNGWRFDNTYSKLPESFLSNTSPTKVKSPELLILNENLVKDLGLDFIGLNREKLSNLFSVNDLPEVSKDI